MQIKSEDNVSPPIERGIIKTDQQNVLIRLRNMHAPNVGLPKIADVGSITTAHPAGTCEAICPVNAPVVRREPVDISKDKNN